MHSLALIDLKATSKMQKSLKILGFTYTEFSAPPDKELVPAPFLILYRVKPTVSLDAISHLRYQYPNAYIALIVESASIDPEYETALLTCCDKDGIWKEDDLDSLFALKLQEVESYLQLKQHYKEANEETSFLHQKVKTLVEQYESTIKVVENIQRSILPKWKPDVRGIQIQTKYIPADGLGGDYYDIFEFGDKKRLGILISDSKTHGMAAALLSVLIRLKTEEIKDRFPKTNDFVNFLNQEFFESHLDSISSMSLLYGIFDRSSLELRFTAAGEIAPQIFNGIKWETPPKEVQNALGVSSQTKYKETTYQLAPGNAFFLHTDGLEKTLGKNALTKIWEKEKSPQDLRNDLLSELESFKRQNPIPDDITFLHFLIDSKALFARKQK